MVSMVSLGVGFVLNWGIPGITSFLFLGSSRWEALSFLVNDEILPRELVEIRCEYTIRLGISGNLQEQ